MIHIQTTPDWKQWPPATDRDRWVGTLVDGRLHCQILTVSHVVSHPGGSAAIFVFLQWPFHSRVAVR